MPLKPIVDATSERPKLLVVVLSLNQAAQDDLYFQESSWSPFLTNSIDGIFVFVPSCATILDAYTNNGIHKSATELLHELSTRTWIQVASIVLIGRSFGGHIIQQAMITGHDDPELRKVIDATIGIVFMGTVQNETDAEFKTALSISAATELDWSHRGKKMRAFTSDQYLDEITSICHNFRSLRLSCKIVSFYEKMRSSYKSRKFLPLQQKLVVPQSTVILEELQEDGHQTVIGLNVDHLQLSSSLFMGQESQTQLQGVFSGFLADVPPGHNNAIAVEAPGEEESPSSEVNNHFRPKTTGPPALGGTGKSTSGPPAILPCRVIRPYQRNPAFTGRTDVLDDITEALTPKKKQKTDEAFSLASGEASNGQGQKKMALIGLGGIGKTQVALAYAFKSFGDFPVILWAHAETEVKLAQSFSEFDEDLGLFKSTTSSAHQAESRERVKRWLSSTEVNWLLVFDNVDAAKGFDKVDAAKGDPKIRVLDKFWPQSDHGSILVTARDQASLGQFTGEVKKIEKLGEHDGIELLLKLAKKEQNPPNLERASEICLQIDYHPLAISSVAGMVVSRQFGLDDYLEEVTSKELVLESTPLAGPEAPYSFTLATVWTAQFADLDKDTTSFLHILSFLDQDGMKEKFLFEGIENAKASKGLGLRDVARLRTNLCMKGLIYRNEIEKKVWMHRLIQDFCHSTMGSLAHQEAFDTALQLILNIWPVQDRHNRHNPAVWPTQQELSPHLAKLSGYYEAFQSSSEPGLSRSPESPTQPPLVAPREYAELLYNGGWYFYERGNFPSALPLLQAAERYCVAHPDGSEAIMADIYGAYASADSESNDVVSCQENFQRQLDYLKVAIEKGQVKRPNVREALAYGGLGNATMGLKKYRDAEPLYRKCLEIWKDCPGDPSIYIPHFGVCLTLQGRTTEAEEVLMRCIEEREARFGPRDTKTYRTGILYYALGNVQVRQQRFDQAYQTHLHSMKMLEATIGPNHHRCADACYKVGWHLMRRGDYDAARQKLEQALKVYQREPIYCNEEARTHFVLGLLFDKTGDKKRAAESSKTAEALRRQITGAVSSVPGTEEDFDELIMFWSR